MKVKEFYSYRTAMVVAEEGMRFEENMVALDAIGMTEMWHQVLRDNGHAPDNHIVFVIEDKGFHRDKTEFIVKLSDWRVTIYDARYYKVVEGRF